MNTEIATAQVFEKQLNDSLARVALSIQTLVKTRDYVTENLSDVGPNYQTEIKSLLYVTRCFLNSQVHYDEPTLISEFARHKIKA